MTAPADPATDFDQRRLRDAFGCFATGVAVVTTRIAGQEAAGFTLNGFTSVSLDPPLLLISVARAARSLAALEKAGFFAVNVLHLDQQHVAERFTTRDVDRFERTQFEEWSTGAPILKGCMASFECETHQTIDAGDHRLFLGLVRKLNFDPAYEPLLYLRGAYRRVHTMR